MNKISAAVTGWHAALAGALLLFGSAQNAGADTLPLTTSFQPAYTGSWYDPLSSGEGFDVWTFTDGDGNLQVFVAAFLGAPAPTAEEPASGLTPWFVSGGTFSGATATYPVLQAHAALGKGSAGSAAPAPVGTLTLSATNNSCSALSAHLTLDEPLGLDKTYNLVPLVQPLASSCAAAQGNESTQPTVTNERVCIASACSNAIAVVVSPAIIDQGCSFSVDLHYGGETYQGASAVATDGSSTNNYSVGGARFTVEADDTFIGPTFMNNLERCGGSVQGPL